MQTTADIVHAIGRDSLQRRLRLSPQSVSDAIRDGKFPARWFGPMEPLAAEKGIPLPRDLFHWREGEAA